MKTIYIIKSTVAFFMAFFMASCTDYLDNPPHDTYTNKDFEKKDTIEGDKYTTKAQALTLLKNCYQDLRNEFFQFDQFQIQETLSDNAYAGGNDQPTIQMDYYTYDALNTVIKRDWGYLYKFIANTNTAIQYIPLIPDPALTADEKKQMVGEAKFLRAYYYFLMSNLWGDVPLVLQEAPAITAENLKEVYPLLYPARVPKSEVDAQIEKDLLDALAQVTPANPAASDKSVVTKGTVHALLARYYVTMKEHDKAITHAQSVISSGYELLPNFEQLWDLSTEHSKESLLEVDYTSATGGGNWCEWILLDYELVSKGQLDWQRFCTPSHALIGNYESENDKIRLEQTVYTGTVTWDVHWPSNNYKFPFKIRNKANNIILFRLADVLLLKAEAHAYKNELTEAMELVNQVRARVNLPPKTATSKEQAIGIVMKERQMELAFEGHRWYDLLRWGQAIQVMDEVKDKTNTYVYRGKLTPFRLLLPVPQAELDKNASLVQNQGY